MPRMSKRERERLEAEQRRKFQVENVDGYVATYDPERGETLRSVVDGLVTYFQTEDPDTSFDGMDMVVWQHDRLVAVVRKGPDGKPQATIF